MSTQTVRAGKPDDEPMTPVIIKSGGGGVESKGGGLEQTSRASSPVEIESDGFLPFAETVPGLTWESSQSTKKGRITNLTIDDGAEHPAHKIDPTDKLASVTLMYGLDQLMVMESGVPPKDVVLVITSPAAPFDIPQEGHWTRSNTTFPNQITSVALTVGSEVKLFHECKTPDVKVTINFDQNPPS